MIGDETAGIGCQEDLLMASVLVRVTNYEEFLEVLLAQAAAGVPAQDTQGRCDDVEEAFQGTVMNCPVRSKSGSNANAC